MVILIALVAVCTAGIVRRSIVNPAVIVDDQDLVGAESAQYGYGGYGGGYGGYNGGYGGYGGGFNQGYGGGGYGGYGGGYGYNNYGGNGGYGHHHHG